MKLERWMDSMTAFKLSYSTPTQKSCNGAFADVDITFEDENWPDTYVSGGNSTNGRAGDGVTYFGVSKSFPLDIFMVQTVSKATDSGRSTFFLETTIKLARILCH